MSSLQKKIRTEIRKKTVFFGLLVFAMGMLAAVQPVSAQMTEGVAGAEVSQPSGSEQEKKQAPEVDISGICLKEQKLILEAGKKKTLTAMIMPKDATDPVLEWSSTDPSIVTVSKSGRITAKKKGTAKIRVRAQSNPKISATCKVIVRTHTVSKIKLKETEKILDKGQSVMIQIKKITPVSADIKSVSYKSSNPKIATVSAKGKVIAKKFGKCTITVQAKDGSEKTAHFTVKVRRYQRKSGYYPIRDKIILPSGGYSLSTKNIGLKVIKVNRRLRGTSSERYTYATKTAVQRFQRRKHLPVTGVVNRSTWLKMGFSESSWYNLGTYRTPEKISYKSTASDCRDAMLKTAREYAEAGTAYRVGCSGKPGTYVDCSGLIYQCLYAAGINPDTNIVDHALAKYEYTSAWLARDAKLGRSISYKNKKTGDIIFYSRNGRNSVAHIAIYAGNGKIYDSWPGRGVTKRGVSLSGYHVCKIRRVFG